MKTSNAEITECVGPRCSKNGMRISTSGITDNIKVKDMLSSVLSDLEVTFARTYPKDK